MTPGRGNDLNNTFSNPQNIRHFRTGKYLDEVTGLYYNQARWYDPQLGRFISESPIAPFGEEEYVYCGNDPVNYVDLDGFERTWREIAVDWLSKPVKYIFDNTLGPIVNNLSPQWRANTPAGLFPEDQDCTSVSVNNEIGELSYVVADEILAQLENKFLPLQFIFLANVTYTELVKEAELKYPKKAGRYEDHHIIPKYLGGDPNGPKVKVPAAYHQLITNEFRKQQSYGSAKPSVSKVKEIMKNVYKLLPIKHLKKG